MIWVFEIVVLLAFVAIGGFYGFIAWAVLTALVMFAHHSSVQTKLKATELLMREEESRQRGRGIAADQQAPPRLAPPTNRQPEPASAPGALGDEPARALPSYQWAPPNSHASPVDFRTMTWGGHMVRRLSATEWQHKYDADFRALRLPALREQLRAGPKAQGSWNAEVVRLQLEGEIENLEPEPTWKPFPEKYIAAIETAYQRFLIRG